VRTHWCFLLVYSRHLPPKKARNSGLDALRSRGGSVHQMAKKATTGVVLYRLVQGFQLEPLFQHAIELIAQLSIEHKFGLLGSKVYSHIRRNVRRVLAQHLPSAWLRPNRTIQCCQIRTQN